MKSSLTALVAVSACIGFAAGPGVPGSRPAASIAPAAQGRPVTLEDAIQLANRYSPILAGAAADVAMFRASARGAKAKLLPAVSANGFATTGNRNAIVGSAPGIEPPALMGVPGGQFAGGSLMLMAPIFVPSLSAAATSAGWQAKAAEGELAETGAELALRVTEAYDEVLLARELILAQQAKVDAANELVRTTQAQVGAGKGILASEQRAQSELAQAQRALTTAKNGEAKAVLDLEDVVGVDLGTGLEPTEKLTGGEPDATFETYLARAKKERGTYLAALARSDAAAAGVRAAQGEGSPQLYGVAMAAGSDHRDMNGLTAGLTLSFPLFDGGRIRADVSQAKATKTKADESVRQAWLDVEKQIRQAWLDVETAKANRASAEAEVQAAQAAYDVIALRVSAGKSILVEQLDALETLTGAKADLAQALYDQAVAVARLNRAAGGVK